MNSIQFKQSQFNILSTQIPKLEEYSIRELVATNFSRGSAPIKRLLRALDRLNIERRRVKIKEFIVKHIEDNRPIHGFPSFLFEDIRYLKCIYGKIIGGQGVDLMREITDRLADNIDRSLRRPATRGEWGIRLLETFLCFLNQGRDVLENRVRLYIEEGKTRYEIGRYEPKWRPLGMRKYVNTLRGEAYGRSAQYNFPRGVTFEEMSIEEFQVLRVAGKMGYSNKYIKLLDPDRSQVKLKREGRDYRRVFDKNLKDKYKEIKKERYDKAKDEVLEELENDDTMVVDQEMIDLVENGYGWDKSEEKNAAKREMKDYVLREFRYLKLSKQAFDVDEYRVLDSALRNVESQLKAINKYLDNESISYLRVLRGFEKDHIPAKSHALVDEETGYAIRVSPLLHAATATYKVGASNQAIGKEVTRDILMYFDNIKSLCLMNESSRECPHVGLYALGSLRYLYKLNLKRYPSQFSDRDRCALDARFLVELRTTLESIRMKQLYPKFM